MTASYQLVMSAILFDMDGLMLDTERLILWGWQQAMADFGYPAPVELYLRSVGVTEERTNEILREALGETFPVEAVRDREREHVRRHIAAHGVPLKPGLLELLDYLDRRGLRRAVASSAWRSTVEAHLSSVGLLARLDAIAAGDEVAHGKPAPDVFLLAASRLEVAPARCLVLEDSEPGAYAAQSAGMAVVVVPDLKTPSHDVAELAAAVLPDLYAVRSWLEQRLPGQP
jgi:HAD superfamily hydrolase (TIGR01509 family)